jgi:putative tryptophan/tyrosine transport system substrate-binding protein
VNEVRKSILSRRPGDRLKEAGMDDARRADLPRRRAIAALGALALLAASPARAANALGRKRLGILAAGTREEALASHASTNMKPLEELGWVEGKTLEYVWRFGEHDESRFPALARELVAERPDVIGTEGTSRTRALQQATRSVPIITSVGDPVGAGFAKSLARPGGNITGLSQGVREAVQKQVELIRAAMPQLATLAIIRVRTATFAEITEPVASAARAAGLVPDLRAVSSMADVESALRAVPGGGRGAAYVMNVVVPGKTGDAIEIALRLRVPVVGNEDDVEKGAIFAYKLVHEDEDRRFAITLDRLLRGADPGSIPFELPQRSVFVINRRAAAAVGVRFPADFALRATRVIE